MKCEHCEMELVERDDIELCGVFDIESPIRLVHTTDRCRDELKRQRDAARAAADGRNEHLAEMRCEINGLCSEIAHLRRVVEAGEPIIAKVVRHHSGHGDGACSVCIQIAEYERALAETEEGKDA